MLRKRFNFTSVQNWLEKNNPLRNSYPLHEFHDTFDPCPLFRVRRWLNQQSCVTSFWGREWEVKAIPGTRHTIYWLTLTRLNKTNCQFDFSKFQHRNQILKIIWTEDQLRGIEGNSSEIRASCWHERRRSGLRSVFCFLSMAAATSGIDFRTCLPYNFKYDVSYQKSLDLNMSIRSLSIGILPIVFLKNNSAIVFPHTVFSVGIDNNNFPNRNGWVG